MFKLSKFALAVLGGFAITACGGGSSSDSSSDGTDSTPSSTVLLPVAVQAASDDLLGADSPKPASALSATTDNKLVVCLDVNNDKNCSQDEYPVYADQNGQATIEWDPNEVNSNVKVIAVNNSGTYLHYGLDKLTRVGNKYDKLYLSTLTSLQDEYGSPEQLQQALGLDEAVDFASRDITGGRVNTSSTPQIKAFTALNDSLYQLGAAQSTSVITDIADIASAFSSIKGKIEIGFTIDDIVTSVKINIDFSFSDLPSQVDPANKAPNADFAYLADGLTVSFVNKSTDPDGDALKYVWSFGDGTTSTASEPTVTYAKAGTYTVSLTVQDTAGKSSKVTENVTVTSSGSTTDPDDPPVTTNTAPVAGFNVKTNGLAVTITDVSTDADGDLLEYKWDFGDGNTSNKSGTFTYNYQQAGTYTIKLTVSDGDKSSTASASVSVASGTVNPPDCSHGQCTAECPQNCEEEVDCSHGQCTAECPQNCEEEVDCSNGQCSAECPQNCNTDELKCTLQ